MKKDQIVMTGQYQDHRLTFEGQNRKLNEVPTNITFESKKFPGTSIATSQKKFYAPSNDLFLQKFVGPYLKKIRPPKSYLG